MGSTISDYLRRLVDPGLVTRELDKASIVAATPYRGEVK